jgi:hypothetical protein
MLTLHVVDIPMVGISNHPMIKGDSVLLYTKSIIINVNNNNLSVLHMVNESNNSLKTNYQLNKLQIKSSLFKRVNLRYFIKIFLSPRECIED